MISEQMNEHYYNLEASKLCNYVGVQIETEEVERLVKKQFHLVGDHFVI